MSSVWSSAAALILSKYLGQQVTKSGRELFLTDGRIEYKRRKWLCRLTTRKLSRLSTYASVPGLGVNIIVCFPFDSTIITYQSRIILYSEKG